MGLSSNTCSRSWRHSVWALGARLCGLETNCIQGSCELGGPGVWGMPAGRLGAPPSPSLPRGAQTEAQASEGGSCLVSGAQAGPGRLDGAERPLQAGSGDPVQRRAGESQEVLQRRQSMSPGPGVCELSGLTPCSFLAMVHDFRLVFELPQPLSHLETGSF